MRNRARVHLCGGFLLALASAILGLTACQMNGDAQEGPAEPGYLLARIRGDLSVCVDRAGPSAVTSEDVASVSAAVDAALNTLDRIPPEFGTPSVTSGCPPAIPLTGKRLDSYDLCCAFSRVVRDEALVSPHRLFVYLVPDETYVQSFADKPYAVAAAESLCKGDTCGAMTTALYVPTSVASEVLADGIVSALGLGPRDEGQAQPTLDWAACAQGTPRPWCRTYESCKQAADSDLDCAELWKQIGGTPAQ